jgi:hypothetical protein
MLICDHSEFSGLHECKGHPYIGGACHRVTSHYEHQCQGHNAIVKSKLLGGYQRYFNELVDLGRRGVPVDVRAIQELMSSWKEKRTVKPIETLELTQARADSFTSSARNKGGSKMAPATVAKAVVPEVTYGVAAGGAANGRNGGSKRRDSVNSSSDSGASSSGLSGIGGYDEQLGASKRTKHDADELQRLVTNIAEKVLGFHVSRLVLKEITERKLVDENFVNDEIDKVEKSVHTSCTFEFHRLDAELSAIRRELEPPCGNDGIDDEAYDAVMAEADCIDDTAVDLDGESSG